jgi:hypothetical protein
MPDLFKILYTSPSIKNMKKKTTVELTKLGGQNVKLGLYSENILL